MELFSILCDTCAAKLRVTRPNAVGQVLACPKCQSMVRVVPPPGWEPSPEVEKHLSKEDLDKIRASMVQSSSNFEDIDSLLKSSPLPTPPKPKPKRKPSGNPNSNSAQFSKAKAAQEGNPMLPTNDWTSAQSQKNRKVITIVAIVLGAILILGGTVVAILVNSGGTPVAQNQPGEENTTPVPDPNAQPEEQPSTPSEDPKAEESKDPEFPESIAPVIKEPDTDTTIPSADPTAPENANPITPDAPPEIPLDGTSDSEAKPELKRPPTNPLAGLMDPEPEKVEEQDSFMSRDIFNNLIDEPSELGSLGQLLDQANTSITKIKDLAEEIQDQQNVGISKYFVEKTEPLEIEVLKKLDLPCAGMLVQDANLVSVFREITMFTGVPFAFDTEELLAVDSDFRFPVTLKMEQTEDNRTTFMQAISELVSQHDLKLSPDEEQNVVKVELNTPPSMSEVDYPLPAFASDPDLSKAMTRLIRILIAPQSWDRDQNPGSLELVEGGIRIQQSADIHRQLRDFFSKLKQVESKNDVQSRWTKAQPALQKPLQLTRSLPKTLDALLTQIEQEADVVILVDWHELSRSGWNPTVMVPGEINEPTVEDTLKEICRSMKLAFRALDEKTFEITSFDVVTTRVEVEVYPYEDIIRGALKQEQLFAIVNQTIGRQLRANPNVRMEFFPQVNCIVAVAPQTLQRQIELIFETLRNVGK